MLCASFLLHRPLVIAGPFGTGKRVLLQRLFESLPGRFAAPIVTTTKETSHPDVDDRWGLVGQTDQESNCQHIDTHLAFSSTCLHCWDSALYRPLLLCIPFNAALTNNPKPQPLSTLFLLPLQARDAGCLPG
jgi:hypothetical protein